MRERGFWFGSMCAIFWLALAPASSAAPFDELRACSESEGYFDYFDGPDSIAPGRTARIETNGLINGDSDVYQQSDDGAWTLLRTDVGEYESIVGRARPAEGAGSVTYRIRWATLAADWDPEGYYDQTDCRNERQVTIPVVARNVRYSLTKTAGIDGAELFLADETNGHPCTRFSAGPTTVTVRSSGKTRQIRYTSQCLDEAKHQGGGSRGSWELRNDTGFPTLTVYLDPARRSYHRHRRFRITLTQPGGQKTTWRLKFHALYLVPETYWEGTDAYWNYCVRRNRDVKQRDGRLYCVRPARSLAYFSK